MENVHTDVRGVKGVKGEHVYFSFLHTMKADLSFESTGHRV